MNDKAYSLIENEDGTLTVYINEGITRIEEYPFMPKFFERNENVTEVHIPNSLESCYIDFSCYFPGLKKVSSNDDNPNWGKFRRFKNSSIFASDDQPREDLPYLIPNGDGTFTLNIPEGVRNMNDVYHWRFFEKVTVINFPASMESISTTLSMMFPNLQEFHIHPQSQYFTMEDGVLFSKDKKKIIRYPRGKAGDTYYIDDCVEEICEDCFAVLNHLKKIYIGKGVRRIGDCSLERDMYFCLTKIYIPPTVTELKGEIFDVGVDDGGKYYPIDIVGGARGSVIEEYCSERGIDFIEVSEDEVDDFYAMSVEELRERAMQQVEEKAEFFVDESYRGYQMRFEGGTLEVFVPDGVTMTEIAVGCTRRKIDENRRKKVKALVIGEHITKIEDLAFDDYDNLESISIGPDVCSICPDAFNGKNASRSFGCKKVSTITVDENNKWYKAIDNILYTYDMQTLVKYAPAKPELYHELDSRVRHIGDDAFEGAENLQCLKVGEGCVSVGKWAFLNTAATLRHAYFAASVVEWPELYPFVEVYGWDSPWRNENQVIGGPSGSAVQKYCADQGVNFHIIEDGEIDKFLAAPAPSEEEDTYLADCKKVMLVDEYGTIQQIGEIGEELVFPEGVTGTRYRINLSKCKRVGIPSTMIHLWSEGFDGPANDLAEFVVSENNPKYMAIEGHLCTRDGCLLTYAPGAAAVKGVLPEGITSIDGHAFQLSDGPFEKLYIPSTVANIEPLRKWGGLFYEAEVSPDNPYFKSVDGSIFTADGKKLVRVKKLSEDYTAYGVTEECDYETVYAAKSKGGYTIPDGTEELCEQSLVDVGGTLFIPASVTKIQAYCNFGGVAIRAVKGSYGEKYAKENNYLYAIEIVDNNGEVVEKLAQCKPEQTRDSTDMQISLSF